MQYYTQRFQCMNAEPLIMGQLFSSCMILHPTAYNKRGVVKF
jgi:hypothetical protein